MIGQASSQHENHCYYFFRRAPPCLVHDGSAGKLDSHPHAGRDQTTRDHDEHRGSFNEGTHTMRKCDYVYLVPGKVNSQLYQLQENSDELRNLSARKFRLRRHSDKRIRLRNI